jgi:hypothetical protein
MYGGTKFEFKKAANLPAASPYPLIEELGKLEGIDPRTFVKNARTFLSRYGVTKAPALKYYEGPRYQKDPADKCPSIFLLGNPYRFVRETVDKSIRIVVSQVWNRWIDTWGRLSIPGGFKEFTEKSIYQGFYDGDASRWPSRWQYWIFEEYVAEVIFNESIGLFNTDDGIFLNTHQQGFRDALFHEIFHAFESRGNLSASSFFAEGFAEYFAILFGAAKPYNLEIGVFPQYEEQFKAVKALVEQAVRLCDTPPNDQVKSRRQGLEICVRAFYGDDMNSLEKLLPMFDADLRKTIPENQQLSRPALDAGMDVDCISSKINDPNKKEKEWYKGWLAQTVKAV